MTKNGNYDTKNGSLTCNYDGQSSVETIKDVLHFKKLTYFDRVGCVNVQKVFKIMNLTQNLVILVPKVSGFMILNTFFTSVYSSDTPY